MLTTPQEKAKPRSRNDTDREPQEADARESVEAARE